VSYIVKVDINEDLGASNYDIVLMVPLAVYAMQETLISFRVWTKAMIESIVC
jgi:hypothetical protein